MVLGYNGFMSLKSPAGCHVTSKLCAKPRKINTCMQNIDRRSFVRNGLFTFSAVMFGPSGSSPEPEHKDEGFLSRTYKKMFAAALEGGEVQYDRIIAGRKKQLFSRIKESDVVLDIGIGTGPNLKYMPKGIQVIGVDPNRYMWPYASEKAEEYGINLNLLDGVAENVPLNDECCDVVVTTLALCSVKDVEQALHEILRVLKPGGQHLFIEHVVASPDRPILRGAQNFFNPLQVYVADGCHLNRETGTIIHNAKDPGYSEVEFEEFDALLGCFVDWINPVRPHICGFARKAIL